MEEEEEEQQFRGEEAGRGIREALCSAYSNHAFPPHPNPSSQPAEFPSLELKRRPAAGKRVRRCGLSFLQCSCVEIKMIWSGRSSTTDGIKVKASVRSVNSVTLYLCFALFLCFRFRFEPKKKKKKKWDLTLWMKHDDRRFLKWTGCQVSDFSEHTTLFLNGSTWVPWSARLHSEECWSWSLQLNRLP